MAPIRVALVGYGLSGSVFQAPLIRAAPGLELVSVCSASAAAASSGLPVRSFDQILGDPAVELVVLATPTAAHVDGARRALRAGKHVVVEKPMAATGAEADALVELARRQRRVLTAFHNRRWDGDFLTIQGLLAEGVLGDPVWVECRWDRFRPEVRDRWRERPGAGAGVWYDLGSHMVDQMLQLFGPPKSLSARMGAERSEQGATDWFDVALDYPGGPRVRLGAGSVVLASTPRFVVQGRSAAYVKFGLDGQEDSLRAGVVPGAPGWGADPTPGHLVRPEERGVVQAAVAARAGDYPSFYPAVRDAIRLGKPPPVQPEEAAMVVRVLELAVRSAELGRRLTFEGAGKAPFEAPRPAE